MSARTTRGNKCAFCEKYEQAVEQAEFEKLRFDHDTHFRVRLYVKVTRRKGREYSSKTHLPMRLKYCPSCGKQLVEKERY